MGWLKLLLSANNAQGCREAMHLSYKKHVRGWSRVEVPERGTTPHHVGLYGALSSRYRMRRIRITENEIWAELVPFLLMSEGEAPEALAEYVVYQERPREARIFWLKQLINDSLRKVEFSQEPLKAMAIMAVKNNFAWCGLVTDEVKDFLIKNSDYEEQYEEPGDVESDDLRKFSIDDLSFSEGLARVRLGGKWGYVDKTGEVIIKPRFNDVSDFLEGLAKVNLRGKWGYIDKMGNIVILPIFDYIEDFSEGGAIVEIGGKYGLIDRTGKYLIEPQFDFIWNSLEGISLVEKGGKWGYVETKSGRVIVEPKYDGAQDFSEGLARVCIGCKRTNALDFEGGKWGYIDKKGDIVIKPRFGVASDFKEGLAKVCIESKCGFIDKMGKMVVEMNYDDASDFSEGLARVSIRDKWGFIDKTGKIIIEPKYDDAGDFKDGLARVNLGRKKDQIGLWEVGVWADRGKWGYIDKMGEMVIQPQFDDASDFYEGEALVKIQGNNYLVGKTGNLRFFEDDLD